MILGVEILVTGVPPGRGNNQQTLARRVLRLETVRRFTEPELRGCAQPSNIGEPTTNGPARHIRTLATSLHPSSTLTSRHESQVSVHACSTRASLRVKKGEPTPLDEMSRGTPPIIGRESLPHLPHAHPPLPRTSTGVPGLQLPPTT